jgi:hypothetical protein
MSGRAPCSGISASPQRGKRNLLCHLPLTLPSEGPPPAGKLPVTTTASVTFINHCAVMVLPLCPQSGQSSGSQSHADASRGVQCSVPSLEQPSWSYNLAACAASSHLTMSGLRNSSCSHPPPSILHTPQFPVFLQFKKFSLLQLKMKSHPSLRPKRE